MTVILTIRDTYCPGVQHEENIGCLEYLEYIAQSSRVYSGIEKSDIYCLLSPQASAYSVGARKVYRSGYRDECRCAGNSVCIECRIFRDRSISIEI